jgi:hypothetical protein
MSEQVVSKREIACEYLDAAIEFYLPPNSGGICGFGWVL